MATHDTPTLGLATATSHVEMREEEEKGPTPAKTLQSTSSSNPTLLIPALTYFWRRLWFRPFVSHERLGYERPNLRALVGPSKPPQHHLHSLSRPPPHSFMPSRAKCIETCHIQPHSQSRDGLACVKDEVGRVKKLTFLRDKPNSKGETRQASAVIGYG